MLNSVKSYRCDSDKYHKSGLVVRKYGKVYRDRVCSECGKEHWHRENMCISCRNTEQRMRHGYWYIKLQDSAGEIRRQVYLAEHIKRINREMEAIEAAGLSPTDSTIEDIENAGIELHRFDVLTLKGVIQ